MKIDIDPADWANTPTNIQQILNLLVQQINNQQVDIQASLNRLLQVYHHQSLPRTAQQVVMVAPYVTARQYKYACGLNDLGWQVILIHLDPLNYSDTSCFAEIRRCTSEMEVLSCCLQYAPTAYHLFTSWKFELPAFLIGSGLSPVLFDDYDLVYGCVNEENLSGMSPASLALERFCLESADAITMRDTRLNIAKARTDIKPSTPYLMLDGACSEAKAAPLRSPKRTDGIHAVFVGNVTDSDSNTPRNFHFELARILSNAGIHYHLYPSQMARYEEYLPVMNAFAAEHCPSGFVHLHPPVPADSLISEISQYHFGIDIVTTSINRTHDDHPVYLLEYTQHGLDNKLFDYISAGLFTFAHSGKACMRILERYGLGMTIPSLEQIAVESKRRHGLKVPPIPETLTTDYWCKRLVSLYEQLSAKPARS